jgi:hypothetical protein
MAETLVPNRLTYASVVEMYAVLRGAWRMQFRAEPTRANLLILLAHWSLETGQGRAMHCYNIGNVKHVAGDGYDYCQFRCSEIVGGTEVFFDPPHPATSFRAYATLEDGCADYLILLSRRFGRAWLDVMSGDVAKFCADLKALHYYTADEAVYQAGVERIVRALDASLPPDTSPALRTLASAALEEAADARDPHDDTPPEDPTVG